MHTLNSFIAIKVHTDYRLDLCIQGTANDSYTSKNEQSPTIHFCICPLLRHGKNVEGQLGTSGVTTFSEVPS